MWDISVGSRKPVWYVCMYVHSLSHIHMLYKDHLFGNHVLFNGLLLKCSYVIRALLIMYVLFSARWHHA